jgi:outer membrane protein OmpA-like peptidoglycan-associated protein
MYPAQDREQNDAALIHPKRKVENQSQARSKRSRKVWAGIPELFVVAVLAVLLGAYGASVTQIQNIGINMTVPAQPPVFERGIKYKAIGVVFFPNGNAKLDPIALSSLNKWGRALRDCRDAHFVVTGSTSSAPFAKGIPYTNVDLANDRAAAVVSAIKPLGVSGVESRNWKPEDDRLKVRTFNDHPSQFRNLQLEAIARRADIIFEDMGSCRIDIRDSEH